MKAIPDLKTFCALPGLLHSESLWIPQRASAEFSQLRPGSPFWQNLDGALFLETGKGAEARCAAFINRELPDFPGMVGFFEARDERAAALILARAQEWLAARGKPAAIGPMNGSTWHRYRLRLAGDAKPFLLEPWNPDWYPAAWQNAGWSIKKRYYSVEMAASELLPQERREQLEACLAAGYRFRQVNLGRRNEEIAVLYRLSTAIFEANAWYSPIPQEEFARLYAGSWRHLKPWNLVFALDPEGREIGFIFALPDAQKRLRRLGARPGPTDYLAAALTQEQPTRVILKTIGVAPGFRRVRVGAGLLAVMERSCLENGFTAAVHALMSEDNVSRTFAASGARTLGEYGLFGTAP